MAALGENLKGTPGTMTAYFVSLWVRAHQVASGPALPAVPRIPAV